MAALSKTVDPGSGASGDYVSLVALESAEGQDLTDGGGDTFTAICTTTGDNAADTSAAIFNGFITAAANYVRIRAASGDEAVVTGIDATRYRLAVSDAIALRMDESFMRVDGLQVIVTITANNTGHGIYQNTSDTGGVTRISNCYVKGICAGTGGGIGIRNAVTDNTVKIWNTIVTGFYSADETSSADWLGLYGRGTFDVYNTIVYGCSTGIRDVSETPTVTNSAFFNNDDDFLGSPTIDYCASDDNDGTNNIAGNEIDATWSTDFADAGNGDFTLLVGSPLFSTGGVDNPGSGLYSTDIAGTSYVSTWPIGAFQPVVAGGETRSFAGAVVGQSSIATAELNLTTQITGNQIIAQSTISADLILTTQITGNTIVGQSVVSGNLTTGALLSLAGNIVGQSVVTGELQQTISIGGNVDAQSTVSGALQQTVSLGGSVSGQSTVSGTLTAAAETRDLAGTIDAVSVVSGNLTTTSLSALSSLKKEIWDMLVEDSTYIGLVGSPSAVPYQTFYLRNPIRPTFPEVVFSLAPGRVNKNLAPEFLSTEYELKFRIRTWDGGYEGIGDRIIQLLQHKPSADLGFRSVVSQSKELVDHKLRIFGKDLVFKVFYRRVT